jgi:hypothetical protein
MVTNWQWGRANRFFNKNLTLRIAFRVIIFLK